jgi:hypothetical protein
MSGAKPSLPLCLRGIQRDNYSLLHPSTHPPAVNVLSEHSKAPSSTATNKAASNENFKKRQHKNIEKLCWQAAAFHRLSVNIKQLFLANFVVDSTGNFIVFSTD